MPCINKAKIEQKESIVGCKFSRPINTSEVIFGNSELKQAIQPKFMPAYKK
jgi:hypothetical protein